MNREIIERIKAIDNKGELQFFFGLLAELIQKLAIGPDDEHLALNVRNDYRKRFSVNINGRLVLSIQEDGILGLMLNNQDLDKVRAICAPISELEFGKGGGDASWLEFKIEELERLIEQIKPLWLKSCEEYLPKQERSQYRNKHIEELYEMALDSKILDQYMETANAEINPMTSKTLELIAKYKEHIKSTELKDEIYKWKLATEYKGKPDVNAENFTTEIGDLNYQNLIYGIGGGVLKHLARDAPKKLRELFTFLFDDEIELQERIEYFNAQTLALYREIAPEHSAKQHHQDERSMATYLAVHDASKYPFYKNSFYRSYCKFLEIKPQNNPYCYVHYNELINDFIDDFVSKDEELLDLKNQFLQGDAAVDSNNYLLAQDILYQSFDKLGKNSKIKYWRVGTKDEVKSYWPEMQKNNFVSIGWHDIGDLSGLDVSDKKDIMTLFVEAGYTYDKRVRSRKAGEIWDFYDNMKDGDRVLAQDGHTVLGIGIVTGPYFYQEEFGFPHTRSIEWLDLKDLKSNTEGNQTTVFQIQDKKMIKKIEDIIQNKEMETKNREVINLQNPSSLNTILFGPPGTGKTYELKENYFPRYTSKESNLTKEKHTELLLKDCSWWQVIALTLLDLGNSSVSEIFDHEWIKVKTKYSNSKSITPTLWGQLQAHTILECELVKYKSRTAPYIFNKMDDKKWEILKEEAQEQTPELLELYDSIKNFTPKSDVVVERYVFTTFHQSFSYEDFIEGIKPVMDEGDNNGELRYEIKAGIFKQICRDAENDPENRYAIFIDEINRGNVSAIFGELITLIEADKRAGAENAMSVMLPYSKEAFSVPKNLDIYGTMNTADRSVESLDSALRRRFSFEEMRPKPALLAEISEKATNVSGIDLVQLLTTINERIELLLDKDHQIGHSYFIGVESLENLRHAFANKVIPLLEEYFFGDFGKIGLLLGGEFIQEVKSNEKVKFASNFKYEDDTLLREKAVYKFTDIDDWTAESFRSIYTHTKND